MTTNPEIFSLKEQLADDYIKSFTKELNVLQKAGVLLVESKMKKLLLQQDKLPDTVEKLQLIASSDWFTDKTISFSPKTTLVSVGFAFKFPICLYIYLC